MKAIILHKVMYRVARVIEEAMQRVFEI